MVERKSKGPHLDSVFGALGDVTRRGILAQLALGPARISDLAEPLPMSFAAVSKHVGVLERAGLVRREVRGREHYLELEGAALATARDWLDRYRIFWEQRLDALAALVEERRVKPTRQGASTWQKSRQRPPRR